MSNYQIINKLYMRGKPKYRVLRWLLNFFMIMIVLFHVFEISMGGETIGEAIRDLVLPVALFLFAKSRCSTDGYESAALELSVLPNKIELLYPSIDRFDGGGVRKEFITIENSDIDEIMYSNELKSIRMLAKAVIEVTYRKNNKQSVINQTEGKSSEYIIYMPPEQCNEIIEDIERNLNLTVQRVD